MKLKIKNVTKYRQKAIKISFVCSCKYVCVYGCGCMCERVDRFFYHTYIFYLTPLILFTPFYFIAYIPPIRSIVCNSYAISHLVIIIIIIIQFPHCIYYTNIFTTQYNLTYTHCNSCSPYTFTNQILTNSLQLAAMMICPTANETNVYTFVTHFRNNQRFKFLA